ncbi:hypothetical protein Taro_032121, partial [Colocasia esculenta]|nr:hypothetical protein [Colocasia esculenta]
IWVHQYHRYSHPFRVILTPSGRELAISFCPGIRIAYVSTIRNRHSETVDRTLVLQNSVPGRNSTADCVYYCTDCRTPWVGCGYFFAPRSEPTASPQFEIGTSTRSAQGRIRRFPIRRPNSSPGGWSRAADAIAYGYPFTQTGITFCSVIEIAYKTPIQNRHSETLVTPLSPHVIRHHFGVVKPSFRTPKLRFRPTMSPFQRFSHNNVYLDYMNPWRGGHTESGSRGDRKLCSTRHENSSTGRRYGCTNIADIVTPSGRELAITIRPGIRIAYVSTIRNRHSETVDRTLVLQNSMPGRNSTAERVY